MDTLSGGNGATSPRMPERDWWNIDVETATTYNKKKKKKTKKHAIIDLGRTLSSVMYV